jgi:hypothetical protein
MVDEQRQVLGVLGQRWSANEEDGQPVVEIGAEAARLRVLGQRPVGGGHDAHIHLHGLVVAHPLQFAALDKAQQLGLQAQRHLADLVQKQRASVGGLDAPDAPCTAPVKAPRVWPKSSASSNASGMAAQLMATNGLRLRVESRCSASATSSLPEPVGPSISTGVMRGATSRMRRLTSSMQGALPISSGSRSLDASFGSGAGGTGRAGCRYRPRTELKGAVDHEMGEEVGLGGDAAMVVR